MIYNQSDWFVLLRTGRKYDIKKPAVSVRVRVLKGLPI